MEGEWEGDEGTATGSGTRSCAGGDDKEEEPMMRMMMLGRGKGREGALGYYFLCKPLSEAMSCQRGGA